MDAAFSHFSGRIDRELRTPGASTEVLEQLQRIEGLVKGLYK